MDFRQHSGNDDLSVSGGFVPLNNDANSGVSSEMQEIFETAPDLLGWKALTQRNSPGLDEIRGQGWEEQFCGKLFHGEYERVMVDVVKVEGTQHIVERSGRLIQQSPAKQAIALQQLSGESKILFTGDERTLRSGDMTIFSADSPYSLEFEGQMSCFMIRFPPQRLGLSPEMLARVRRGWRSNDLKSGRLLSGFVTAIAEDLSVFEGPAGASLANNLVDLLKTTFIEHLEVTPGYRYSGVFTKIIRDLENRLGDTSLTPQSIADTHFISVRNLHGLFRDQGTTVSRWIREKRLEQCARDLSDPAQYESSIREIAQRNGYENAAHFSTSFKDHVGLNPSEWRRRMMPRGRLDHGAE